MSDDATPPMGIGDQTFYLQFEDRDVVAIERTRALFLAFHPVNRTYENASLFLQHGLRKKNETIELVYALPQDDSGKAPALELVKSFCKQFSGPVGMAVLYAYCERALVTAGYFGGPQPDDTQEAQHGE
jgi:hypothetical protein